MEHPLFGLWLLGFLLPSMFCAAVLGWRAQGVMAAALVGAGPVLFVHVLLLALQMNWKEMRELLTELSVLAFLGMVLSFGAGLGAAIGSLAYGFACLRRVIANR